MKLVLKEDIKKIGKRGEVVNVSDGYARNFLIPKGKAIMANNEIIKQVQNKKEKDLEKIESQKKLALLRAKEIEGKTIEILAKAGDKGELFAGIGEKEIKGKLDFEVEKINIEKPIKAVGDYEVEIKLKQDVGVKIKIKVLPE